jgi:hypothetical protein
MEGFDRQRNGVKCNDGIVRETATGQRQSSNYSSTQQPQRMRTHFSSTGQRAAMASTSTWLM